MTTDLMRKSDLEQFQEMEVLLAAIIRKAELRSGQDPTAVEIADLAKRCEALVKDLVLSSSK